jgi:putative transposase
MPVNSRRSRYFQHHTELKIMVHAARSIDFALEAGVARSTAVSWVNGDFSRLRRFPEGLQKDIHRVNRVLNDGFLKGFIDLYTNVTTVFHLVIESVKPLKKALLPFKAQLLKAIDLLKERIGLRNALKLFGISFSRYYAWAGERFCPFSLAGRCRQRHPLQIAIGQVVAIKEVLLDPAIKKWPLVSAFFHGLRQERISCSINTFYKYAKLMGFSRRVPGHRHKNHAVGIRAERPNQIWHADITVYRAADNVKIFIYFVMDNFSRMILSWKASLECSSKVRAETILEAYRNHVRTKPRFPITLLVDGGPENKPIPAFDPETGIQKIVAQIDTHYSNSMVEATNKIAKYRYLYPDDPPDFEGVVRCLEKNVPDHNWNRPNGQLGGLTPAEAYYRPSATPAIFLNAAQRAKAGKMEIKAPNLCIPCQ